MYWLNYFFDNYLRYEWFMLIIGGVLLLLFIFVLAGLPHMSNLARLRRGGKAGAAFFKDNKTLNRYNRAYFNRRVVSKLPNKARRIWERDAVFSGNYCSYEFEESVKRASRHAGNAFFALYVGGYIAALIVILATLIALGAGAEHSAIAACGVIFGGAVMMLALAIELYFLDKKTEKAAETMLETIRERIGLPQTKIEKAVSTQMSKPDSMKISDSSCAAQVEDAQQKGEQLQESVSDVSEIKSIVSSAAEAKEADLAEESPVRLIEARSADDLNALINGSGANKSEAHVEKDAKRECETDNRAYSIEKLVEYEEELRRGRAPITATGVNSADDSKGGSKIDELEARVNMLINGEASDETLIKISEILREAGEYEYASDIDNLRLKCLLRRLEKAI